MAIQALHSAATGMNALSTEIDVISNNLANVNTTGFKASRVNFEDLIYQQKRQPGVENGDNYTPPAGLQVGMGTRISNTQFDFRTGSPVITERPLDVFIEGDGFFEVEILEEYGGGTGYTRAGNFFVNSEGDLVLGNSDGPRVAGGINISGDVQSIEISPSGEVVIHRPDNSTSNAGTLQLHKFVNASGLQSIGGNIYVETEISGPPTAGEPGQQGFGKLGQGMLESSNVNPVTELVSLIKTQRAFEMNSQTIQAADEVLQVVGNLRRF
ncbi:MAG: flagellar basal-body rod protein FlgG [Phycisphaerales bacterium JB063]